MTRFYNDFGGNSQPNQPVSPANPTNNSYGLSGRINDFGGNSQPNQPVNPTNNSYGLLGRINEFAKTVQDPEGTVKQLLSSGKMSQDQFNQYAQIANMFMGKNGGQQ